MSLLRRRSSHQHSVSGYCCSPRIESAKENICLKLEYAGSRAAIDKRPGFNW
jgi:hypothetical protein